MKQRFVFPLIHSGCSPYAATPVAETSAPAARRLWQRDLLRLGMLLLLFLTPALTCGQAVQLKAGGLSVALDRFGFYSSVRVMGEEVLRDKGLFPIVSAWDYEVRTPQSIRLQHDTLRCLMSDDSLLLLRVGQHDECLTLEVIAAPVHYSSVTFGPLAVALDEVVGEVVGVAQGHSLAFGFQALNAQTVGGLQQEAAEAYGARFFYSDTAIEGRPLHALAAVPVAGGALFQFSALNRMLRPGVVVTRHIGSCPAALAYPLQGDDASVVGAKVALFGCQRKEVLNHLGRIELSQGLPHPLVGGVWVKRLPTPTPYKPTASHVFSPLLPWDGAFDPASTLPHLSAQLQFQLQHDLAPTDTTLLLLTGAFSCFPLPMEGQQVVRVDDELIAYRAVADSDGYIVLSGCRRGASGTQAAPHSRYTLGRRLWSVKEGLVPDMELLASLADRQAGEFNRGRVTEASFRHLAACALTGHDDYAVALFVKRCFEGAERPLLSRADYLTNYTWHYHWGTLPPCSKDFARRNLLQPME